MTALLFFERSLICLTFFLLLAVIGLILVILAPNRFRKIDIFFDSVIFYPLPDRTALRLC